MKTFCALISSLAFASVSCEKHDFEGENGTKQLHEHHSSSHAVSHEAGDHGGEAQHEAEQAH